MSYKMPWEEDCGQTFAFATVEGYLWAEKFLSNKRVSICKAKNQ